ARPALQVDHDDALGLAPARTAGLVLLGRASLELEQRAEAQAQEAGAADAQQVAAREAGGAVAQVRAGLSGDDDHRLTPRYKVGQVADLLVPPKVYRQADNLPHILIQFPPLVNGCVP